MKRAIGLFFLSRGVQPLILKEKSLSEAIDEMEQSRAELLELVSGWTAEQAAFRPDPEAWSASEVMEHLHTVEFRVTNRLWAGIDGVRLNQPIWTGEHTNRGCSIETVVADFEQGKYKTPPAGDVKIGGPLPFWVAALDACQPVLNRLRPALQQAGPERIVFPHHVVGPLDGEQWIPFLRFHLNRHRKQIERLRTMDGFPA
jgi:hypothetical protein